MAEQLKNSLDNPTSTLASGITSGATSLTVAAGHGARFPATGTFRVKLTDASDDTLYELVICTARSTDTLTVTRAGEGTTARAFVTADHVDLVQSAAALVAYVSENSAQDADVTAATAASVILAPASSARNVIQPTAGDVIAAIVKAHAAQSVDLTQWQKSDGSPLVSISELGLLTISPSSGGVGLTVIPADYYGEFDPVNRGGFAITYPGDPVSAPGVVAYVAEASSTYDPGTYPADRVMGVLAFYSQDESAPGATTGFIAFDGNGSMVIAPYGYAAIPAIRVYDNVGNYTFQVSSKGAVAIKTVDVAAGVPFSVGIGAANPYAWWVSAGGHEVLHVQTLPADGDVGTSERWQWYDDTIGAAKLRFKQKDSAGTLVAGVSASEAYVDTATGLLVAKSLFDANTVLAADTDNTPAALTMGASTILARLAAGNIKAATPAELRTLLTLVIGTDVPAQATFDDHSARHESAGADAIKLDDFAAPDDNTDLNASTTKHGLLPKLSNVATEYLSGTGAFSTPSGSGIPSTIVDAKGDLIAATAADTVARLAVGANDFVLTADSAQATGIKWAAAAGGGIAATIFDAKGDIIVATAADTAARKAAGANGTVLSADSAQSDGLAWVLRQAATGYTTGMYIPSPDDELGTVTPTIAELRAYPVVIMKTTTFDRITADQTGGNVIGDLRLGIYRDNGSGFPGDLVLDAGTVSLNAGTGLKNITISQQLEPGVYWLAAVAQGLTTIVRNMTEQPWKHIIQTALPNNYGVSVSECATKAAVIGALPTPFASTTTAGANTSVAVYLRVA